MEGTLNLNNAQCIVERSYIGYDKFYNICTDVVTTVPWSPFIWIDVIAATVFVLLLVFTFIAIVIAD